MAYLALTVPLARCGFSLLWLLGHGNGTERPVYSALGYHALRIALSDTASRFRTRDLCLHLFDDRRLAGQQGRRYIRRKHF